MEPKDSTATGGAGERAHVSAVPMSSDKDIQENKDLAALSYAWVLAVVVYATRKDSPFVRFHAKQGLALFILSIGVWFIPYVGRFLEFCIVALCVLGFLGAAQGQWKDVPVIGPLSRGEWSSVFASVKVLFKDLSHTFELMKKRVAKGKGDKGDMLRSDKGDVVHAQPPASIATAVTPATPQAVTFVGVTSSDVPVAPVSHTPAPIAPTQSAPADQVISPSSDASSSVPSAS